MDKIFNDSERSIPANKLFRSDNHLCFKRREASENGIYKSPKILVVGTGGIGVELLKNLLACDFRDISIIDLDTIELSNLNRQFLFRQEDIGESKAKTAKLRSASFNKAAKVTAYHGDVMAPDRGVSFFNQFDLIANALDNLPTRRHVNRICLSIGKPLLESGTQGYSGQVYLIMKGFSECYECTEKSAPKTYPICTLRDTPDKPVHCIAWAKLMFGSLFGPDENKNELSDLTLRRNENESGENFGKRLFVFLFETTINDRLYKLRKSKELDKNDSENPFFPLDFPKPLLIDDLPDFPEPSGNTSDNGVSNLVSLKTQFVRTITEIVDSNLEKKCVFDKDDPIAMDFVHSAAALRMANYGIPRISQFESKGIAGNIVHAIATTNAVCAALMAAQAEQILLKKDFSACKRSWIQLSASGSKPIQPERLSPPNPQCYVCSKQRLYLVCNVKALTLRELFDDVFRKSLGMASPVVDVSYGAASNFITEELSEWDGNVKWRKQYFENPLAHEHVNINHGSLLTVEDDQQAFSVAVIVAHCQEMGESGEGEERYFLRKQEEYSIDLFAKRETQKKRKKEELNFRENGANVKRLKQN